jgi:hypothetical protein
MLLIVGTFLISLLEKTTANEWLTDWNNEASTSSFFNKFTQSGMSCRAKSFEAMDFIPKPKKRGGGFSADPYEDDVTPLINDPVVASAMEEDQARKRAKKGGPPLPGNPTTRNSVPPRIKRISYKRGTSIR